MFGGMKSRNPAICRRIGRSVGAHSSPASVSLTMRDQVRVTSKLPSPTAFATNQFAPPLTLMPNFISALSGRASLILSRTALAASTAGPTAWVTRPRTSPGPALADFLGRLDLELDDRRFIYLIRNDLRWHQLTLHPASTVGRPLQCSGRSLARFLVLTSTHPYRSSLRSAFRIALGAAGMLSQVCCKERIRLRAVSADGT